MLLTTKRVSRDSKCNNCRNQKTATIPLAEGSKRKASKIRERAYKTNSAQRRDGVQLILIWCLCL